MKTLLLVEDDAETHTLLAEQLSQAGYEVLSAFDGARALELAHGHGPDLVLLDLMLPGVSGLEVCKRLKADDLTRLIPIIIVTARAAELDRVVGLELGAADYVTKPFSVRELLLRIRNVLKVSERQRHALGSFEFGVIRVDGDAHQVWVEGREIALSPMEFRLLVVLIERANRVQSRAALIEEIWHGETQATSRTIDTHVKRLREKLGPAGGYLRTVRAIGYMMCETLPLQQASGALD